MRFGQDDLRVQLWSADRLKGFPVSDWLGLSVEMDKHPTGKGSIALRSSSYALATDALDINAASPEFGANLSMDVYFRDMTTALFSGPVATAGMREGRGGNVVELSTRTWFENFAARRLILTGTNDAGPALNGKVDVVVEKLLDQNGFDSSGTLTPAAYPGGVSRTDFGGWTVATATTGGGSHATDLTSTPLDIDDGRQVLDYLLFIFENFDLTVTIAESPAATFTFTITTAYQNNDKTNEAILDVRFGTLASFAETLDYTVLENTVMAKGSGGSPPLLWGNDATSTTDYGVYEGVITVKGADADNRGFEKDLMLTDGKTTDQSWSVKVLDSSLAVFNVDYALRDLVTCQSGAWTRAVTKQVVGCKLSHSGRVGKLDVLLGAPPRSWVKEQAARPGRGRGGKGAGSRYIQTSG